MLIPEQIAACKLNMQKSVKHGVFVPLLHLNHNLQVVYSEKCCTHQVIMKVFVASGAYLTTRVIL